MRVRVELRRKAGIWIPRFRPQSGVTGELTTHRREIAGRLVPFLIVHGEPLQGYPKAPGTNLELFEAKIVTATPNYLHFVGFEVVVGERAIHCQEWDCYFLPG